MYDYDQIRSIHLELTSKCQARCPMCPRRINGGPVTDLEEFELQSKIDVIWSGQLVLPKYTRFMIVGRKNV